MDEYVKLAKTSAEEYIKKGGMIDVPQDLPDEFYSRRAGVFVTIRKNKELRGCIGTYLPTKKNIAQEVIYNTISACCRDPRFPPVSESELNKLNYEVSILSEPRLVKDINKLDPKKNGIIVKCSDGRCGLLLPDLDGIDSIEQQILIASQKGDINPQIDGVQLYSFTVEKHF